MSEPAPAVGKSYAEIVVHAFRKNRAARAALWVSVLMILAAVFSPLIANDRPFAFRGSLPGEFRRAALAAGRGAVPQLVGLPARFAADRAKFEKGEATLNDLLVAVTPAEARALFDPLERLRKRAEGMPEIRGRWVSRDVTLTEILAEAAPAERPAFEAARARILRDLPSLYEERLRKALDALQGRLEELADQAGPATAGPAREILARIRAAVAAPYLAEPGDRKAVLLQAGQEIRALFDPDKTVPLEQWRFPLFASLDVLDALFLLSAVFLLIAFGPLTWWGPLRRVAPLERRWALTWAAALVPALLLSGLWGLAREAKFETVSYKKGLEDGTVKMSASVWPPCRYRYDEVPEDQAERLLPPSSRHLFGTDYMGRDLFSRMLWGSRISLSIGFAATVLSVIIGVVLGAMAGFFGGWVDIVLSRIIEIMICFPRFFIILAVVAFLPPNIFYVMLALGVFGWMGIARLQRGEFLRLRNLDFVSAAQALGATSSRMMFRHLLPNGVAPVLVSASFGIASAMLTESGLSFLGLGVQDPATSWGQILYTGRSEVLQGFAKWWSFTIPGAAIFLAVTCYNLVGDGIRDAVDPRLKT
jgi:peptide/nickel transport system permease protein